MDKKVVVTEAEISAAQSVADDMASYEVASLQQGKTRDQLRQEAEDGRTERFRQHFECIAIIALWLAAIVLAVLAGIWFWHLVSPACWRWLTKEDLWTIQTIITAGALLSVATGHFKKRLD